MRYLLVFAIGMYFGGLFFLGVNYYFQRTNFVRIPEDIKNIRNDLKKVGLIPETFGSGNVVSIVPNPGSITKKGRTVNVIMRNDKFSLPNLYGIFYLDGLEILKVYNLNVEIVKIKFPGPDGRILASFPSFGTMVNEGEKVKILVDSGEFGGIK
ncbi:PASTA domain containing protein [Thermosipho melanesiensis BI429]|uniref:PASTA domain containing protein n=1 Tax=Thermosipho melanesiensis (strain DSM 12029 / CIP 104789 / BI429) TaxID=391009 RepID=A6LN48_THEM4|nr:PASTA domain-containing protein [Thermosipho melanesiensis]ABR31349.1 PASTA domain containing protein [Thermosipho melanesiensis BI429]